MPRLDQLLARNLGLSRRVVTRVLRSGSVRGPGGEVLRDPRLTLAPGQLPFTVDVRGRQVQLREHVHLMQHKPVGVVTSRKDNRHPTAWDLLEGAPMHAELKAVGRLDLDASGLLLWTTEGPRIHALTHPRRAVSRVYEVALARPFEAPPRDADGQVSLILADGSRPRITALAGLEGACHPALPRPPGTEALASVTLLDGSHHEVKRIFAALGSHVLALTRVAHAGLRLPEAMAPGEWIELEELPSPSPQRARPESSAEEPA